MATTKFKIESGIQMITRLTKKPDIEKFFPILFRNGVKQGYVIEMYSKDDMSCVLCDIICEALIPLELGGKESGVIVFNTDGRIKLDVIINVFKKKLASRLSDSSLPSSYLQSALRNLFIIEIYDATQLHTTIQSMENILMNHANISLIVFDTLTAFYWSEQSFKVVKMDVYLKSLLKFIQKVMKDYKVVTMYTRPQYFSSSIDQLENFDPCYEDSTFEQINYRVHVVFTNERLNHAMVKSFNEQYKCSFNILDDMIVWS